MHKEIVDDVHHLLNLMHLGFDPDGEAAQKMETTQRRERIFLSRHCLDPWDFEAALRNIHDCFSDTTEVEGPVRRSFKKQISKPLPFDHCDDVAEALRFLYMLDGDDRVSIKKEFENKFIWNFFIIPIVEHIRSTGICNIDNPAVMMIGVSIVLDEIRNTIRRDEAVGSFKAAVVSRAHMMSRIV